MNILYLNVYAVTRHYGGPQEGSWWFNAGEPLASVPIPAKRERGCDICTTCRDAKENKTNDFCKRYPEDWDREVEDQARHDLWYSQGKKPHELESEDWDKMLEEATSKLEALLPEEYHLVPSDLVRLEGVRQFLGTVFADHKHGNIYSVLGGVDVQTILEDHFAQPWPEEHPRYQ